MRYNQKQQNFLLASKVKEFNSKLWELEKVLPHKENALKDKIVYDSLQLLELVYEGNLLKSNDSKFKMLIKISMLDYYFNILFEKKYIGEKQLRYYGYRLEEITKMVYGWIKSES